MASTTELTSLPSYALRTILDLPETPDDAERIFSDPLTATTVLATTRPQVVREFLDFLKRFPSEAFQIEALRIDATTSTVPIVLDSYLLNDLVLYLTNRKVLAFNGVHFDFVHDRVPRMGYHVNEIVVNGGGRVIGTRGLLGMLWLFSSIDSLQLSIPSANFDHGLIPQEAVHRVRVRRLIVWKAPTTALFWKMLDTCILTDRNDRMRILHTDCTSYDEIKAVGDILHNHYVVALVYSTEAVSCINNLSFPSLQALNQLRLSSCSSLGVLCLDIAVSRRSDNFALYVEDFTTMLRLSMSIPWTVRLLVIMFTSSTQSATSSAQYPFLDLARSRHVPYEELDNSLAQRPHLRLIFTMHEQAQTREIRVYERLLQYCKRSLDSRGEFAQGSSGLAAQEIRLRMPVLSGQGRLSVVNGP